MESNKTIWKTASNFGIILGLALVIYSILIYAFDQVFNQTLGFGSYIIIIVIVFIGTKKQRDESNGILSYSKGLGTGVVISIIGTAIFAIFTYILYEIIDPDLITRLHYIQEQEMIKTGIDEDSIKLAMTMVKKYTNSLMMFFGVLVGLSIFGIFISLITSAIIKKTETK